MYNILFDLSVYHTYILKRNRKKYKSVLLFYDEKLKLKSCLSKSQKLKFRAISIKKKFMHDGVACMLLNPIDISLSFTTTTEDDSIGSLM